MHVKASADREVLDGAHAKGLIPLVVLEKILAIITRNTSSCDQFVSQYLSVHV